MSFKCQVCGKPQQPRTKPNKVVTQIRNVQYSPVKDAGGNYRLPVGWEICKEISVCQNCKLTRVFFIDTLEDKILE